MCRGARRLRQNKARKERVSGEGGAGGGGGVGGGGVSGPLQRGLRGGETEGKSERFGRGRGEFGFRVM